MRFSPVSLHQGTQLFYACNVADFFIISLAQAVLIKFYCHENILAGSNHDFNSVHKYFCNSSNHTTPLEFSHYLI